MTEFASLEEIAAAIAQCTKCPLHQRRTHTVPGEGNVHAELMFIGEGPGEKEDATGRPFVGAAGKFLEELLGTIGLTRQDVFIANIVKCRPPENRDPEPIEIATCTHLYLYRQIELIKPKIIATLGRHAMNRFLPDEFRISQVHGKPYRRGGQVYLPLYHPAAALYTNALKETLRADFLRIPKLLTIIASETASTNPAAT